jgi:hypothetical protein
MDMSDRPFEVVAHARACREHAGKHERENHGEPAVGRESCIEADGMLQCRNALSDRADDVAEQLQRKQDPGDRP